MRFKRVYADVVETPVGEYVAVASDKGLLMLSRKPITLVLSCLREQAYETTIDDNPVIKQTKRQLGEYFARRRKSFTIELDLHGTDFQRKVWSVLREIPYGEVVSYKQLAYKVGVYRGYRAVGNAVGANPIPIIIPCHRVVRSDYTIGGYSNGVEVKKKLLELEDVLKRVRFV